jgi:hypothetical protein
MSDCPAARMRAIEDSEFWFVKKNDDGADQNSLARNMTGGK